MSLNQPWSKMGPMEVVIRKARMADLKTVQDLNAGLFKTDGPRDKFLNHKWPYQKAGKTYFKKAIAGKNTCCFVAEIENEIVGYLAGGITKKESWRIVKKRTELENVFVKDKFRSMGVGKKLMDAFLNWSQEVKAERALVVAYATNEKAIKFYKKNGFIPYGFSLETEIKK